MGQTNLHMTDISKDVKIIPRRNDCRKEHLSQRTAGRLDEWTSTVGFISLYFYVSFLLLAYIHCSNDGFHSDNIMM